VFYAKKQGENNGRKNILKNNDDLKTFFQRPCYGKIRCLNRGFFNISDRRAINIILLTLKQNAMTNVMCMGGMQCAAKTLLLTFIGLIMIGKNANGQCTFTVNAGCIQTTVIGGERAAYTPAALKNNPIRLYQFQTGSLFENNWLWTIPKPGFAAQPFATVGNSGNAIFPDRFGFRIQADLNAAVSGIGGASNWQVNPNNGATELTFQNFNGSSVDGKLKFIYRDNTTTNALDVMEVRGDGRVGISTTTTNSIVTSVSGDPTVLTVNGSIYSWGTNTYYLSDKRYKNNIQAIDNALDKVMKLQAYTYYFNQNGEYAVPVNKNQSVGYIAQEVKEIIPLAVGKTGEKETYSMNYMAITPYLSEAIKEQQKEIEALRQLTTKLRQELENLSASFKLSQNVPNPAQSNTTIAYRLPKATKKAVLNFYDGNGRFIKTIPIATNATMATIDVSSFASGQYQYSLLADNKLIATKKISIGQ
jgi:hypothetical protein